MRRKKKQKNVMSKYVHEQKKNKKGLVLLHLIETRTLKEHEK